MGEVEVDCKAYISSLRQNKQPIRRLKSSAQIKENHNTNLSSPIYYAHVDDAIYDLKYINSKWQLGNKRLITNTMPNNQSNIIVVLESPHIDEFDSKGKGLLPLQNDKFFYK